MSVTHDAYPIAWRDGLRCKRCHVKPATYRAVRRGAHPHTMAAKYRCVDCMNEEGIYRVMGEPKGPWQPTPKSPRARVTPFERKREVEMEKLKSWSGTVRRDP